MRSLRAVESRIKSRRAEIQVSHKTLLPNMRNRADRRAIRKTVGHRHGSGRGLALPRRQQVQLLAKLLPLDALATEFVRLG